MRFLLLAIAACAAAYGSAPAAADVVPGLPSPETEIGGVLGRWDRARAQHDVRVLAELLAPGFVATGADGDRRDRERILADGAVERGARLITRDAVEIDVDGSTATARARVTRIGTTAGPQFGEVYEETATLRRSRSQWRLVSIRSAPLVAVPTQ